MLKKLSLAALVAMGSMSVASATDLSEAIKGVQLNGMLRLRITNDDPEAGDRKNTYRTSSDFKFTIPVSEELKVITKFGIDGTVDSDLAANNVDPNPGENLLFVNYAKNGLNVKLGKIPVGTPVTGSGHGEAHGAGAIATYKASDALTVAVAGIDALKGIDKLGGKKTAKNIYAVGANYASDVADVKAWYFKVDDTLDSDIVVSADIKAIPAVGLHVDFATSEPAAAGSKTNTYANLSVSFKQDALCAKVGYAVTGKDGGMVVLDGDAPIVSVLGTEQQTNIANTTDNNALYANVSYKVDDKTSVKAAYSAVDADSSNEILVGAKYAYTKKFGVYAYYSIKTADSGDNNQARLELKYTF